MSQPFDPNARPSVVVLITDGVTRRIVLDALAPLADATLAETPHDAEGMLQRDNFSALIVEDELPVETGLMFLARINHQFPWLRRILVCGPVEPELLVYLINEANVFRCVAKPVDPEKLRPLLLQAFADHARLRELAASAAEVERLRAQLSGPGHRLRRLSTALRHWFVTLPRIFVFTLVGAAWVFGLGVVVLLSLYVFKSLLGLDLIEGLHLRDLFR